MPKQQATVLLRIHPTPFKPSRLSIPPSPFSPRSPITPIHRPQRAKRLPSTSNKSGPAPPTPTQWLWQCHHCRQFYAFGATRRCLEDGHKFCSGTTVIRESPHPRKAKRHTACTSEFDYHGWKTWSRWRRKIDRQNSVCCVQNDVPLSSSSYPVDSPAESESYSEVAQGARQMAEQKDCWNQCDYPSECRWGKEFGVHTPVVETVFPSFEVDPITTCPLSLEIQSLKGTTPKLEATCTHQKATTHKAKKSIFGAPYSQVLATRKRPQKPDHLHISRDPENPKTALLPESKDKYKGGSFAPSYHNTTNPSPFTQPSQPQSPSLLVALKSTIPNLLRTKSQTIEVISRSSNHTENDDANRPTSTSATNEAFTIFTPPPHTNHVDTDLVCDYYAEDVRLRDVLLAELAPLTRVRSRQ